MSLGLSMTRVCIADDMETFSMLSESETERSCASALVRLSVALPLVRPTCCPSSASVRY